MASLVLDLQRACFDQSVSTVDVLRMALVVARKLRISDLSEWLNRELEGYGNGQEIPAYRTVKTTLEAWNPYVGWIPVMGDPEYIAGLCSVRINQPIATLEAMAKGDASDLLEVPLPEAVAMRMMRGNEVPLKPHRRFNAGQVKGLVDAVRTAVLYWALKLEEDGIMGEGMTFSEKEKQAASHSTYNVHYHGQVSNSQIQQGSQHSTQQLTVGPGAAHIREFMQALQSAQLPLTDADNQQLTSDKQTIENQLAAPRPSKVIITESLRSIRAILENCVGDVIASGLLLKLAPLLNS